MMQSHLTVKLAICNNRCQCLVYRIVEVLRSVNVKWKTKNEVTQEIVNSQLD